MLTSLLTDIFFTPVIGQFYQQNSLLLPNWGFSKMEEFVTLDSVSASIIYKTY